MPQITVNARSARYPLHIGRGVLDTLGEKIAKALPCARAVVVSDETVYGLYGARAGESLARAGVPSDSVVLPSGEETKSLPVLFRLYERMVELSMSRTDVIVALGGGVIGDLAGVLAATYLRGVPYVQVPTTLLSQIDSSIGGKTAVNLPSGKNLVGAFYHPRMVLIDPDTLATLGDEEFAGGMAEIIKTACILDSELFDLLEANAGRAAVTPLIEQVIVRCCAIKAHVVEADERDAGERLLLNFGHTLAHALEKCAQPPMRHGQAVATGMARITVASERRGTPRPGTAARLAALLAAFGLPAELPGSIDAEMLPSFAGRDKKVFDGKLKLVLLRRIGEAFVHPIDREGLAAFLDEGEERR